MGLHLQPIITSQGSLRPSYVFLKVVPLQNSWASWRIAHNYVVYLKLHTTDSFAVISGLDMIGTNGSTYIVHKRNHPVGQLTTWCKPLKSVDSGWLKLNQAEIWCHQSTRWLKTKNKIWYNLIDGWWHQRHAKNSVASQQDDRRLVSDEDWWGCRWLLWIYLVDQDPKTLRRKHMMIGIGQ